MNNLNQYIELIGGKIADKEKFIITYPKYSTLFINKYILNVPSLPNLTEAEITTIKNKLKAALLLTPSGKKIKPVKNPKVTIVIGPPASGKSTFMQAFAEGKNTIIFDPDKYAHLHPYYNDLERIYDAYGNKTPYKFGLRDVLCVNQFENLGILDDIFFKLVSNNYNIIIPKQYNLPLDNLVQLRHYFDKINTVIIMTQVNDLIDRYVERSSKTGFFIYEDVINAENSLTDANAYMYSILPAIALLSDNFSISLDGVYPANKLVINTNNYSEVKELIDGFLVSNNRL
jgi:hypothetical protein